MDGIGSRGAGSARGLSIAGAAQWVVHKFGLEERKELVQAIEVLAAVGIVSALISYFISSGHADIESISRAFLSF